MSETRSYPSKNDQDVAALADIPVRGAGPESNPEALGDTLRLFRTALDSSGFRSIYRVHCYELAPDFMEDSLSRTLGSAPPVAEVWIRLFYLLQPMDREVVEETLGTALFEGLVAADILGRYREQWMSRYRVELIDSDILFTDYRPGRAEGAYFGEDSQFLRSVLQPRRGQVCLDLCAGTGIQGLRCARDASQVDLVDVNPLALRLCHLNSVVNDVDDRVSVWRGSLYDALPADKKYDYIVSNPPLMPVPDNVKFPIFGHGGRDGLSLVRRIIEGLEDRLRDGGRLSLIGACTGSKERPDVLDLVESSLADEYAVRLFPLMAMPLLDWIAIIAQTASLHYEDLSFQRAVIELRTAYAQTLSKTYVFTYLLECERTGQGSLDVIDYSRVGHRSFWYVNRGAFSR